MNMPKVNEDKNIRVTVTMSESTKAILNTLVGVYGSNMSSVVNTLIMDKFMEIYPYLKGNEEKSE